MKSPCFLRDTWVECCDHLNMFALGGDYYSSYPEGDDLSMMRRVDKVFRPGMCVGYVYDFGSSTHLKIKVMAVLDSCPKKQIALLMRNEPPLFDCESCKKRATTICSFCGEATCSSCDQQHTCAKEEVDTYTFMPIVNSPRTGVCGYGNQDNRIIPSSETFLEEIEKLVHIRHYILILQNYFTGSKNLRR